MKKFLSILPVPLFALVFLFSPTSALAINCPDEAMAGSQVTCTCQTNRLEYIYGNYYPDPDFISNGVCAGNSYTFTAPSYDYSDEFRNQLYIVEFSGGEELTPENCADNYSDALGCDQFLSEDYMDITENTGSVTGLIAGARDSLLGGMGSLLPIAAIVLISVAIIYFVIRNFRRISKFGQ